MRYRVVLAVLLTSLIVFLLFWRLGLVENPSKPDFFVGVDVAYDDVEGIKSLVDEVKSYTNLLVIGSTGITFNLTKLDDVCQYVVDSGLYFMAYLHPTVQFSHAQWIEDAKRKWSDRFLGVYAFDEAGGRQIDCDPYMLVTEADNYTDAADQYVELLSETLKHVREYYMNTGDLPLFTSDYALYWFDYEASYDVVLAQFGWNHSRLLSIVLNRGAASMHNKDWGVMITWTYRHSPYIESGDELYYDMVLAYLSGAKYVVVFNYPQDSQYGILAEEHLDALKRFWSYINTNPQRPQSHSPSETRVAYVLPKDYGWGFRGSEDKVWGLWVDALSIEMGKDVDHLLHSHHLGLDIVYDDPKHYSRLGLYRTLIFWNGTIVTNENL